jgi:glutathione synthase/RimK-type ligase-like ATP-grasp enzyme
VTTTPFLSAAKTVGASDYHDDVKERAVNQPRLALATFREHPAITSVDKDTHLLIEALAEAGIHAENPFWDDPRVNWASFDLVVPRTTWDYSLRHAEFFEWVNHCARVTTILNDPAVLYWNAYKDSYLADLAAKHISVVATHIIPPGRDFELPELAEFVVKPNVGGGSRGAARYLMKERNEALAHIEQIHGRGLTAMVQPYLPEVDLFGERALVFIRGEFMHAIRKGAVLRPGARGSDRREAHPGVQQYTPSPAELDLGRRALNAAPAAETLLYGRVDLVSRDGADPTVMELELVEPNLFVKFNPASMPTVVTAFAESTRLVAARRSA